MRFNIILACLLTVSLSACTSSSYTPNSAEAAAAASSVNVLNGDSNTISSSSVVGSSNSPFTSAQTPVSNRITAGDVLDVNVFKVTDLSAKNLTVEASGKISMPLVGSIVVAGLTISQAEQKITQRLTQFMQSPQVSISRTNKVIEKRVTVEGEVKSPGVFPIKGNLSFLQAIALAQGLSEIGDSRKVFFYRNGERHLVNLDLVRNGSIADPRLLGDDRIVVMEDASKVTEKKLLKYIPIFTNPLSIF